jgi:hypothetical protein
MRADIDLNALVAAIGEVCDAKGAITQTSRFDEDRALKKRLAEVETKLAASA